MSNPILQGYNNNADIVGVGVEGSKNSNTGSLKVASYLHTVYTVANATRIAASNIANNAQVTVYTVPANKTFYLTYIFMNINNLAAVAQAGACQLYDAASVLIVQFQLSTLAGNINQLVIPLSVPFPLFQNETVRVFSPQVNEFVTLAIMGYLL